MPVIYQQSPLSPDGPTSPSRVDESVVARIVLAVLNSRQHEPRTPGEEVKSRYKRQKCSRKNSDELIQVNNVCDAAIREQMDQLGRCGAPVCLELFARNHTHKNSQQQSDCILLEQWTIQAIPKRPPLSSINCAQLLQAVESFTHFSQVRAWIVSSSGRPPFELLYRICGPSEDDVCQFTVAMPDIHNFPLASYTSMDTLQVVVCHLPRLTTMPFVSNCKLSTQFEGIAKCLSDSSINLHTVEHKEKVSLSSSMQLLRAGNSKTSSECSSKLTKLSPKVSSSLNGSSSCTSDKVSHSSSNGSSNGHSCSQEFCFDSTCLSVVKSPTHKSHLHSPSRHHDVTVSPSSSKSIDNGSSILQKITARSLEPSGRSKEISKGRVCPPEASSPIPFSSRCKPSTSTVEEVTQHNCHTTLQRRQSFATPSKHKSHRPPVLRSMSVPTAVSSLSLLGTFEESVLNGRLEPLGVVEGFTADIGASGSFCPRHITLPVMALFFSLSDEDGPSPYMGHINLSSISRKGYHVPRKGTIQVTLFNPNKTVVKMFVVMYDFTDMPPNSQTFLRQRTLSRPPVSPLHKVVPELHYLIHLRFRCSKSGHIYLHTDIRMIFARRAPDIDHDPSNASLYSITEGPTDPRYTTITSRKP